MYTKISYTVDVVQLNYHGNNAASIFPVNCVRERVFSIRNFACHLSRCLGQRVAAIVVRFKDHFVPNREIYIPFIVFLNFRYLLIKLLR